MLYYTYLIGWSKHNKFYYGVRFAKAANPKELFKTYFTSSKHVKRFISNFGNPDIVQIRKTFTATQKARIWETTVLKRMKVLQDDRFLNKTDNISIDPTCSSESGRKSFRNNFIQYKSLEKRNQAKNKSIFTKKQKTKMGAYKETFKKISESVKKTYQIKKLKGYEQPNTFTKEFGQRMAAKNNSLSVCPKCGKEGQYRAMKRWHFERCKKPY